MAEMILQDEIYPLLSSRGFVRVNKVFRRRGDAGLGMTVWLNPENRLSRVRTINVDCWVESEETGWLYSFDQARAVSEVERSQPWGSFDYVPELPGWPAVMISDFERVTVPFIDACTGPEALCDMLLEGRVPPSNMKPAPLGWVQDVWDIAVSSDLPEYGEAALLKLASLPLSDADYEAAKWWATMVGITNLQLRQPKPVRRGWFSRRRSNRE